MSDSPQPTWEQLIDDADAVMRQAYAPYSKFRVGAALMATDGRVFAGCNVENAAFPAGICAERSALSQAVAAGSREFSRLVVVTEADEPTPPCGVCLQALVEFSRGLEVTSVCASGKRATWRLQDLLPFPFTPATLAHS